MKLKSWRRAARTPDTCLSDGTTWQPGNLYVIAGAGTSPTAPSISGSSALSTELNLPEGIAIDREGNVVVADSGSNLIAIIAVSPTNPGYDISSWTRGNIYAIAGNGTDLPRPFIRGFGSATTVGIDTPGGVAVDPEGNVVIADTFAVRDHRACGLFEQPWLPDWPTSTWTDGDLYEVAGGGSTSPTYAGVSAQSVALNSPEGIAVNSNGDVVFADEQEQRSRSAFGVCGQTREFRPSISWTPGNVYVTRRGRIEHSNEWMVSSSKLVDARRSLGVSLDPAGNVLIANSHVNEIDLLAESSRNPGYSLGVIRCLATELGLLAGRGTARYAPSSIWERCDCCHA